MATGGIETFITFGIYLLFLISMIVATITVIFWNQSGLGKKIYEIVPGFLINIICLYILEKFNKSKK